MSTSCNNIQTVSFKMTGLPYQWAPVANHSISIARQFSAQQCWSVLACISDNVPASCHPVDWDLANLNVNSRLFFMSESQFNYFFTRKSAHLNSNSYNFWMQPNIVMKFAGYVVWILLCKHCIFGNNIYYSSKDIKFFIRDYFLVHRVHMLMHVGLLQFQGY